MEDFIKVPDFNPSGFVERTNFKTLENSIKNNIKENKNKKNKNDLYEYIIRSIQRNSIFLLLNNIDYKLNVKKYKKCISSLNNDDIKFKNVNINQILYKTCNKSSVYHEDSKFHPTSSDTDLDEEDYNRQTTDKILTDENENGNKTDFGNSIVNDYNSVELEGSDECIDEKHFKQNNNLSSDCTESENGDEDLDEKDYDKELDDGFESGSETPDETELDNPDGFDSDDDDNDDDDEDGIEVDEFDSGYINAPSLFHENDENKKDTNKKSFFTIAFEKSFEFEKKNGYISNICQNLKEFHAEELECLTYYDVHDYFREPLPFLTNNGEIVNSFNKANREDYCKAMNDCWSNENFQVILRRFKEYDFCICCIRKFVNDFYISNRIHKQCFNVIQPHYYLVDQPALEVKGKVYKNYSSKEMITKRANEDFLGIIEPFPVHNVDRYKRSDNIQVEVNE